MTGGLARTGDADLYYQVDGESAQTVVLVNGVGDPLEGWASQAGDFLARAAQAAGMPMMMRAQAPWIFSPEFYARAPERVAELIAEAATSTQPAAAFAAQLAALVDHDARDRLGTLRVPTLVIAAADDIIIRPALSRRLFEALPDAAWSVVPGGHAAFWENPGPWNRAVIEFVQAHS